MVDWYGYVPPWDDLDARKELIEPLNLPTLSDIPAPEVRLRHIGDSMTAFTMGQNGAAVNISTMPWFTLPSALNGGMGDEPLVFYDAAAGYGGEIFGAPDSEGDFDDPPDPVVGQGDFKRGYSDNGFGNDLMELLIAPTGKTVDTVCGAIGGTRSDGWAAQIPNYLPDDGGEAPSGDYWGDVGPALIADAAAGITPIVTFSIGANDMRDRLLNVGSQRMDDDTYWHGTDHTPLPAPNPEGFQEHPGWETVGKMGEIKSNIEEMIDYIHFLTGGNPTNATITVGGVDRPPNSPGNVEIYIMSYPNWPVRNGEVERWWPAGALDRPGVLSGLWVMDGVGCYTDFIRDADLAYDYTPARIVLPSAHDAYRCRSTAGGTPSVPSGGHLGFIPLADMMDRDSSPGMSWIIADQHYRDYAAGAYGAVNPGDAVPASRTGDLGYNLFVGNILLAPGAGSWRAKTGPSPNLLPIDHPTLVVTSGSPAVPNGEQGTPAVGEVPASDDYAPASVNMWDIAARSVNEETVGNFFRGKLDPMYRELVTEFQAKYSADNALRYVPLWTYREEPSKGDVTAANRPWPFQEMSDILHLNRLGAQHLIEGLFEGILQYSEVLRYPPQAASNCTAPAAVASAPVELAAAVPNSNGTLGCCSDNYSVQIRTRGGRQKILDLSSGIQSLDWSRSLDDVSDAGATITYNDRLRTEFARLAEVEPFAHELRIEREGLVVWEGPLTLVEEGANSIRLAGFDIASWLEVRRVVDEFNYEDSGKEAVALALETISSAMAQDDSAVMLPFVHAVYGTKKAYRKVIPDDDVFAIEELFDLAGELIDWTVVGRRLILMPDNYVLGRLRTLKKEHFVGDGHKIRRNATDYTSKRIKRGNGFSAITGDISERYGLVERVDRDQGALNFEAAQEANEVYLSRRTRVPTIIEMDQGARLDCNAPVLINQLVPGVEIPIDMGDSLMASKSSARLRSVRVNYDVSESGGDESVVISLAQTKLDPVVNEPAEVESI